MAAAMAAIAALALAMGASPPGCAPGSCTAAPTVRVGPGMQCATVQAAIDCIPNRTSSSPRAFVLIAPGTYREALRLHASKGKVSLLGLGDPRTVTIGANETCGGADPTVPCGALQVL